MQRDARVRRSAGHDAVVERPDGERRSIYVPPRLQRIRRRDQQVREGRPRGRSLSQEYLVAGGTGLLGSHIVDESLHREHAAKVLDDFSPGRRQNIAHCLDDIELFQGNARSPATRRHDPEKVADSAVSACRQICRRANTTGPTMAPCDMEETRP